MSVMDLSDVVGSLSSGPLTVTRLAAGNRDAGYWVDGASSEVVVDPATVVPLRAKEVEVLPEGLRTRRAVQVFSNVQLQASSEITKAKGDRFTWGGDTFEVQITEAWGDLGNFWRAVATKVDVA